jgi:hypothetical protein
MVLLWHSVECLAVEALDAQFEARCSSNFAGSCHRNQRRQESESAVWMAPTGVGLDQASHRCGMRHSSFVIVLCPKGRSAGGGQQCRIEACEEALDWKAKLSLTLHGDVICGVHLPEPEAQICVLVGRSMISNL